MERGPLAPTELVIAFWMCVYGAVQAVLGGEGHPLQQVHRNFSETFYLFGASVLGLLILDAFGSWSMKGAIAYAAGRAAYLAFSAPPLRFLRKWAWAVSIAGIVGVAAELARAL